MSIGKLIALVVLLGGVLFLVLHLVDKPEGVLEISDVWPENDRPRERRDPIPFTRSQQCRECHPDVWREWYGSHHRLAYVNPEVQRLSKGFQDRDCLPCHLPRPIPETGFGYGIRPLERGAAREDGVDCFTCHHFPKSKVMLAAGPLGPGAANAPCQPAVAKIVQTPNLCAPCHDQHKVHQEWLESRFAVAGDGFKDCNSCHMPEVERKRAAGGPRTGRHHGFPAAHDPAMLRSAGSMTVTVAGQRRLLVVVANDGTGHNFPADERHRAVDLHLIVHTADGRRHDVRVARFRNPYRPDFEYVNPLPKPGDTYPADLTIGELGYAKVIATRIAASFHPVRKVPYPQSTQIPAGEKRSYQITLPEGSVGATLRLWYRSNPFMADKDAVLLHEKVLEKL